MKVYSAIAAVARSMGQDGISKGRKNVQQGYQFRGIDDVLNALSSALIAAGLVILPRVTERTVTERETKAGGALFYTTVRVEFDLVATEDGSRHTVVTYGEAMDSGDKSTNKAMSAAYKYLALLTFCIPTEASPETDADFTTHEVQARNDRRTAWLAEQFAAIEAAPNAGAFKAIVARAVQTATEQNDADAVSQIQAAATVKAAKAKTPKKETA